LLDAHVSRPVVGRRSEANGHDVRALDQEPAFEGLDDDEVLALATSERRDRSPRGDRRWASS
jgi:hypothetical protein